MRRHEYKALSDRLQQITSSARGHRIWLAERHAFDSVGAQDLVDHSRDELVAILHWIEGNFHAKEPPHTDASSLDALCGLDLGDSAALRREERRAAGIRLSGVVITFFLGAQNGRSAWDVK